MKLTAIPPCGWEANSYILCDNGNAVLIDAGASAKSVFEVLKKENSTLKAVILTHGHFDHTISAAEICKNLQIPLYIHSQDTDMLFDAQRNGLMDLLRTEYADDSSDIEVKTLDGIFEAGGIKMSVIHTPGHTKGSVCLLAEDMLFTGDTLFDGGYGRYDLYGGDKIALMNSLNSLKMLDPKLKIYAGHGTSTSLENALSQLYFL